MSNEIKIPPGTKSFRLTFLRVLRVNKWGQKVFLCKCECGNETEVLSYEFRTGHKKSCGCLFREGPKKSTLQKAWQANAAPPGDASWRKLFYVHKRNCKAMGRENELTLELFKVICSQRCCHCNEEPRPFNVYLLADGKTLQRTSGNIGIQESTVERSWIRANGIDRLDNKIGYTQKNSAPCCLTCNFMKGNFPLDVFLAQCKKIAGHQKSKT